MSLGEERFDITEGEVRITSFVFGASFFLSGNPFEYARDLLDVQDAWLELAGRANFAWYATETMSKHRKISSKTFSMLATWLAPGSPKRDYLALMIKDGSTYNETGATIYQIFANPEFDPAHNLPTYLHVSLPGKAAMSRLGELEKFFLSACSRLPVCSAQAGLGIETSPYFQRKSEAAAWAFSMRHPGLDIFTGTYDRRAACYDGLRTVNWLTALSPDQLSDVGGADNVRSRLPDGVTMLQLENGTTVLRAGQAPQLGDVNRNDRVPLYAAVDAALRPLIDRCMPRAMQFEVRGEQQTATPRWFRRFSGTV